ncbi:MAG: hypothetical protein EKK33_17145 [Bradyrhizobiaceae bacterium]|nr:MAG: hypothetical protein EKK33_17145 [Bradyrhizobiaceae bacterium]
MTTPLIVVFASAIVGLTTALFFRVWSLVLVSPAIAVFATIVLQTSDFGFWTGIPIVIGSLVACQLSYMVGSFYLHKDDVLAQHESDGAPSHHGQQGVGDEND